MLKNKYALTKKPEKVFQKFCAKRASEIVVPPKEMLLSFSCVRFLTNYDVRERKQHIDLTILCVLKTNF